MTPTQRLCSAVAELIRDSSCKVEGSTLQIKSAAILSLQDLENLGAVVQTVEVNQVRVTEIRLNDLNPLTIQEIKMIQG